MISQIQQLPAGNALRVFIDPPANALMWRLLRKDADNFVDQNDPAAVLVSDGTEKYPVDAVNLKNGVLAYYKVYYFNGTWVASATVSGTPLASYADMTNDVLSFVRERIDVGLQVEVARQVLKPNSGKIDVMTAPPVYEHTRWPVVSVHVDDDSSGERGLGEIIDPDSFNASDDEWTETEGWLASQKLSIIGWTQNPDERIALRKSLRRIVVANLPIFDSIGMVEINFSQNDAEDFTSYDAAVYQVVCTLSCDAPVVVGHDSSTIHTVETTLIQE